MDADMKLCLECMEQYDDQYSVCPFCGAIEGTKAENELHMSPGMILKGENSTYTVGKVLGSGSFGTTYIAWDNLLERKVAIKEYLPSEYATRISGSTMVEIDKSKYEAFSKGMEKFIDEARKLAKFDDLEGIVRIYDHFYQNDTAYIVMEYLDGITLADYLELNGKIDPETAVDMLMPVLKSLVEVHKMGIIHRDIAPDNIMITKKGDVKLIDFGAARYIKSSPSKLITVIVKRGFSPEEQYHSSGIQGPHTDVYSLAATLYNMITVIVPPDALERRTNIEESKKNILVPIRKKVKDIPKTIENAIYNALNIRIDDRTQNVEQFIQEITAEKAVPIRDQTIPLIDRLRWRKSQIVGVGVISMAAIALVVLAATGVIRFSNTLKGDIVIPEGMTRVPAIVNQTISDAATIVEEGKLQYLIVGKEYSDIIPKDYVLTQDIAAGNIVEENTELKINVSGGTELKEVPSIVGKTKEEAETILSAVGFIGEITEQYDDVIMEGYVASQEVAQGEYIAKGRIIKYVISLGRDPNKVVEKKMISVPNFVGLTQSAAYSKAEELGMTIKPELIYSEKEKYTVIRQSVTEGEEILNTQEVIITISLGIDYSTIPDVEGFSEEVAVRKLSAEDLKVEISYQEHNNIAEGNVISVNPVNGTKVLPGTTVKIVVSKGKKSFNMPDVAGKSKSEAESILRAKGLVPQVSYRNSDSVPVGSVISFEPGVNENVKSGTVVRIYISSGEKLYDVPKVIGLTKSDAVSKLQDSAFKVQIVESYNDNVASGCIISQTLEAGGQYKKGTSITLMVSKGKQPVTVKFNANGGSCSEGSRTVYKSGTYGALPTPSRAGYTFAGWYTSTNGGSKISGTSIVSSASEHTLYARWIANTYNVAFNANGGNVSVSNKNVTYGSTYGGLPIPNRDYYTFNGWYTASSGGTKITNSSNVAITSNITLYAQWTQKPENGWIDASKVPSGAKITSTKYQYTLTSYTTSDKSTLSGWTLYDTKTSWSGYGNWSEWSTNAVSGSEYRKVETKTESYTYQTGRTLYNYSHYKYWNTTYKRYYWTNSYAAAANNGYSIEYHELGWSTTERFLTTNFGSASSPIWGTYINGCCGNVPYYNEQTKPEEATGYRTLYRYADRNKIYTYYYKKSEQKESSSNPTGESGISEVKKLVKYIEK